MKARAEVRRGEICRSTLCSVIFILLVTEMNTLRSAP
jgi:hypothetical protein